MAEFDNDKNPSTKIRRKSDIEKRSGQERRREPSCGYTCISMVGWICRRERLRRKDDPDCFNNDKL